MKGRTIFVFGSNREGRHGKGAALYAVKNHGAIYGQAEGLQGDSYAIITKELRRGYPPVTLDEVEFGVRAFTAFAANHPQTRFEITRIGCGLAGFKWEQIRPFFAPKTPNMAFIPYVHG
jgi:hypothetical protein